MKRPRKVYFPSGKLIQRAIDAVIAHGHLTKCQFREQYPRDYLTLFRAQLLEQTFPEGVTNSLLERVRYLESLKKKNYDFESLNEVFRMQEGKRAHENFAQGRQIVDADSALGKKQKKLRVGCVKSS